MPGQRTTGPVPPAGAGAPVRLFTSAALRRRWEVREVLRADEAEGLYRAVDWTLGREVALKVVRVDRVGAARADRLRREAALVREADSPRLVKVLDVEVSGDSLFVVSEIASGRPLPGLLAEGPLRVEEAVRIAAEISRGLAVLHGLGVVHRNLSAGSVQVSPEGAVRLGDYGLPRPWERPARSRPRDGGARGEGEARDEVASHAAPEVATGEGSSPSSDLYALGVLLFRMLSGKVPLARATPFLTVVAHVREDAPDVRRFREEVPAWLAAVVARLLEREPERRYAGADELVLDLVNRRAPRARRRLGVLPRAIAASAALAFFAAGAAWLLAPDGSLPFEPWSSRRLAILASDGEGGAVAVDAVGRVLWSRPGVDPRGRAALLERSRGGRREVAALLAASPGTLAFLDPESGATLRSVSLPSPFGKGPGPTSSFDRIDAVPADASGGWAAVAWASGANGASGAILVEPESSLASRLFVAASPGWIVRGVLEGSGDAAHALLVLAGGAQTFGGLTGVAAVPLRPEPLPASPPDPASRRLSSGRPEWFALAPATRGVSVDSRRGVLSYETPGGRLVLLGSDGFARALAARPFPESAARGPAREAAFEELLVADERERGGLAFEELAATGRARALAEASGDAGTVEWALRRHGRALVHAARADEADAIFAVVARSSEVDGLVALEAGRLFGGSGEARRAAAWFRRGLASRSPLSPAVASDLLEGLVLALVQVGERDAALVEIDRVLASFPSEGGRAARLRATVGR